MLSKNNLKISQFISSRLCHDLISPVGAINTGLELLETTPAEAQQEIIDLLQQSAIQASKRLTYYRYAFGQGALKQVSTFSDLEKILRDFIENDKIKLQWDANLLSSFDGQESLLLSWSRTIINLMICAVEALPFGGTISMELAPEGSKTLHLKLDSSRIAIPAPVLKTLQGLSTEEDLSPQTVPAFLATQLAESEGLEIRVKESNETRILCTLQEATTSYNASVL